MIQKKVGLEAEYILQNEEGEISLIPSWWDQDDFPLLGEIRGQEGEKPWETIGNFHTKHAQVLDTVSKGGYKLLTPLVQRISLKTYQEALRKSQIKDKINRRIHNANGLDITEFSDQIIKGGKIQGVNISCGLHVHFSCMDEDTVTVSQSKYEPVVIPLSVEQMKTSLSLYRYEGYEEEKELKAKASQLTRPAIEWIVKEMDAEFFNRFVPEKKQRTKYRNPGYYELKPYGFEYRSLPFNDEVMNAIPEIVNKSFELLDRLNKW